MRIYTFGYQGRSPDELTREAERLNAYVADIRFQPFSKDARWSQEGLAAALGWRYRWVRALGNRNYRGATIQIENLEEGFETIGGLLATGRALILLCVCKNLQACHRKVVADEIEKDGTATVEHLGWTSARPLLAGLFEKTPRQAPAARGPAV